MEFIEKSEAKSTVIQRLYDRILLYEHSDGPWKQPELSENDFKVIKAALLQYQCSLLTVANDRKTALEHGSEDGNLQSQPEEKIVQCCLGLMQELVDHFMGWYDWIHGEGAAAQLPEDERFCYNYTYFHIVQRLLFWNTHHSGGTSTRAKCSQLGLDPEKYIEFGFDIEDEEE